MRIWRFVAAAALLVPGHAALEAQAAPVVVSAGRPAFWSGRGDAEYTLDVRGRADVLRVAIDHVVVGDVFRIQVTDPRGGSLSASPGDGLYSAEVFVDDPVPGRWTVSVTAQSPVDGRFRVRAALEAVPRAGKHVAVLPNLQPLPPYDFTFLTPLTNGTTGGAPQGVDGPTSCHPEEVVEERAVRCLRMAFGVRNTGRGPMWLSHPDDGTPTEKPLYQRVYYADGATADRLAGQAVYHASHGHFHHKEAVALTLFRVEGSALTPLGAEHRKGFAHRSEQIREWTAFRQRWPRYGFGLDAGWGDYYEWDRPGNYIDLGANLDGTYLIRMVADPGNGILESNERDNVAYSYVRIVGRTVTMLESGRGTSPWDRCKILVPFGAEPNLPPGARQPKRPRDCPPDET